ncbi:unnamed protein product [Schistosoma turkestanicum]|nr:unnamed protein product [Schistosoma turkestanicum]
MNENLSSQNQLEPVNFDSAFSTTSLLLTTLPTGDSTQCYEKPQHQQQYNDDEISVTSNTSGTNHSITATTIASEVIKSDKKITPYSEYIQIDHLLQNSSNDTNPNDNNAYSVKEMATSLSSSSPSQALSSIFSSEFENRDNSTSSIHSGDVTDKIKSTPINCINFHEPFNKSLLDFVNNTMLHQSELDKSELLSGDKKFSINNALASMNSIPVRNFFQNTPNNNDNNDNNHHNNTGNNHRNPLVHNKQLDSLLHSQTTLNALSMAYSSIIANGLCGIGKDYENTFNPDHITTTNNTYHNITSQSDKIPSTIMIQRPSITNLFKEHSMIPIISSTATIPPPSTSTTISSIPISSTQSSLFLANSLEKINSGNLSNSFIPNVHNSINNNNNNNNNNSVNSQRHIHQTHKNLLNSKLVEYETNSCQMNFPAIMNDLLIENLESWQHLQKNAISSNIDPHLLTYYSGSCCPVELTNTNRRKNATRETTSLLKSWLNEHRKNPYPTKGEKIMLALITKMSLTQVSTWFANARRRLKKENKVTWNLRTDCLSDVEHDEQSIENGDIDGGDDNDDKISANDHDDNPNNNNSNNKEDDLQGITGLEGLKQYLLHKNAENYGKLSLSKLFDRHGGLQTMIEGNKTKLNSRLRNFTNDCDPTDSVPSKRPSLDYDNHTSTPVPTVNPLNQENEFCKSKSSTNVRLETRKIWSLVDMMNEQNNSQTSRHELFNEKNPAMNIQNQSYDHWPPIEENRNLQKSPKNLRKTSNELFSYQMKLNAALTDSLEMNRTNNNSTISDECGVTRKLLGKSSFSTASTITGNNSSTSSSTDSNNIHIPTDSSSLLSPSALAAFYFYYQQNLQRAQEQNQLMTTSLPHQFPTSGHQPQLHAQKLPSLNSPSFNNNSNSNNNNNNNSHNLLHTKPFLQYDDHFSNLFQGNNALNLNLLNKETQQYARSLCLHKNHSNQPVTASPGEES